MLRSGRRMPVLLQPRPNETQREWNLIGVGCAPGNDAFQLDEVVLGGADAHQFFLDDLFISFHVKLLRYRIAACNKNGGSFRSRHLRDLTLLKKGREPVLSTTSSLVAIQPYRLLSSTFRVVLSKSPCGSA